ncbi:MAG: site-2 protease family protein [Patescibacteria group bacterium]
MINLIFFFFVIIPSAIIHEFSHAWMAYFLGDDTAKRFGRLTLNPLAHIDLFGTILMPIFLSLISGGTFLFAYAKPVPFNPYNLRNQKYGPALVGAAGPLANLLVAIIFGLMVRFLPISNFTFFLSIIVYANILLMVFNLIPIPPLDGSRILDAFLSERWFGLKNFLERNGFLILLFFLFFAFAIIQPIISLIFKLIVGSSLTGF